MNIYQQQILDEYRNPKNTGKLKLFTHTHTSQNLTCGDEITVYLQIEDNKIVDVSYEARGCAICIAAASLFTQSLLGQSLNWLADQTDADVIDLLGIELSATRLKCALLPLSAFKQAVFATPVSA